MAIFDLKALFLFFEFFLSLAQLTCSLSFNFPSFTENSNEITIQGNASVSDTGFIELTPPTGTPYYAAGQVIYSHPVELWDSSGTPSSFSTHFSFTLSPMKSSLAKNSDGLVFFLSSYSLTIPPNSTAQYFGVFSPLMTVPTIAVEFDTYQNTELKDVSANHIGIDIKTAISVASTDLNFSMTNSYQSDAWINYDSNSHNLSVFFSYPQLNKHWSLNYYPLNLKDHLPQEVTVGIGATTGGFFQRNTLLSWNFTSSSISPPPPSISPSPPVLTGGTPPPALTGGTPSSGRNKKMDVYLIIVPVAVLSIIIILVVLWCVFFRPKINRYTTISISGLRQFTYDELVTATKNFTSVLGSGASGEVFRGTLTGSNIEVAVKRIVGTALHGSKAYEAELEILSRLSHRNLVKLIGYCDENDRLLLIYEYMPNKSLDHHLYDVTSVLNWPKRYKIATGLASVLSYLHTEYNQCIIHRDVKPSNVMLDSEFNAKLGDFGIAKLVNHGDIKKTSAVGTPGYMAPESYATKETIIKEIDIFSFGIVALEIACGKQPMENNVSLAKTVLRFYKSNKLLEAADERLKEFNPTEMERLLMVGLSCCNSDPELRMSMRKAVSVLNFETELTTVNIDDDENNHATSNCIAVMHD